MWRSGDRHDGDGGADGDGGEGERCDDRKSGALGEFEAKKHGGIPFVYRGEPFTADVRDIAAAMPTPLKH